MITQVSPTSDRPANVSPVGNYRWTICALLFFSTAINYMDRQILGILKPTLSHDLHWNEHTYANIVTAFQFTYALGYLFGGRLMDKVGVKRGLPIAAFVWSVAAAAHGLARTALGFTYARLALGLSEGGNFPAGIRTIGEWFPIKERALATGIFNSASNVGAIICPLTVPWLAVHYGWPMAFFITGGLGLVWLAAWALIYESPETHPKLLPAERAYIEDGRVPIVGEEVPWLTLLRMRATWAYMLANVLTNPVWWFYLFWIPDFLHTRFHLSLESYGFYTGVIYTISIFGSVAGGWLTAPLMNHGWNLNNARKVSMLIPAICVVPVCVAAYVNNVWAAVVLLGVALASHQAWSANLYTFVSDIMPKRAVGSVVGLGGFMSGLASMLAAQVVGWVLSRNGSYTPMLVWASTMYLLALLVIQLLVPQIHSQDAPTKAPE
jgi:MFS transporter, ACS family, hexuronate transporter